MAAANTRLQRLKAVLQQPFNSPSLPIRTNKSPEPSYGHLSMLREWRWELFTWSLGTVASLTFTALLFCFRDQPVDRWKSEVQMTAIIAALSQTAQSALLVPIASCIGQLKWTWFQKKPRGLINLEQYDQASRGPEGSMKLLFRYPKPYNSPTLFCIFCSLFVIAGSFRSRLWPLYLCLAFKHSFSRRYGYTRGG